MLSRTIRIVSTTPSLTRIAAPRLLSTSAPVFKDKPLSQGHAHTQNQAAQSGSFKDHRGGQQSDAGVDGGNKGSGTEASTSSFLGSVKQTIGVGTKKADHQENKTAPHAPKKFSTSSRWGRPDGKAGKGDAAQGKGARKPVDGSVKGDQNPHLKHKSAGKSDSGKGNAAAEPHLPSKAGKAGSKQAARGFHTSTQLLGVKEVPYVGATEQPAKKSGYDTPGEAHPSANLYEKPPPASPDLTPSSELPHSSTSADPAHETMSKKALDGTLANRNPPPSGAPEEQGLDKGWRIRNAEQKSG